MSSVRGCPRVLWGVAFANIVRGVAIDAEQAGHLELLRSAQPVCAAGWPDDALVFALHGAVFLALKTAGEVRTDAVEAGVPAGDPDDRGRRRVRAVDAAGVRQGLDVDSRR